MSEDRDRQSQDTAANAGQEQATYDALRDEVKKRLAEIKDAVTVEHLHRALDQGTERLRELGVATAESLSRARDSVQRDLAAAAERIGPAWNSLSESSADLFAVWKDRSNAFLAGAASSAGEWLKKAGEDLERTHYRTGDLTYGGNFNCSACGQRIVLAHSGHLPPCPNCMATDFRRV